MYPNWKALVRNLRLHSAPRRLTAMLSILTAFTLLFSFVGSAQPVLAVDYPPDTSPDYPTVNGLFWGDRDNEVYQAYKWGDNSDTVLYTDVYSGTLYVALVVDGNVNDNVFDEGGGNQGTLYLQSAGWTTGREFTDLIDSEYAEFTATICEDTYTWKQGYARQTGAGSLEASNYLQAGWVSNNTIGEGGGTVPYGYESSSSLVWNMNHYAEAETKTYNMAAKCETDSRLPYSGTVCSAENLKSPFSLDLPLPGDTVSTTGGFPEEISIGSPISHSFKFEWEWATVYEWSVPLSLTCGLPVTYSVSHISSHHSPAKTGPQDDDPTPVTLTALAASTSAALVPIAGLVVGVSGVIVAPRRRRRRHQ